MVRKSRKLAGQRLSAAQVKRIIDTVLDTERLGDAREPRRLLVAGGDAGR